MKKVIYLCVLLFSVQSYCIEINLLEKPADADKYLVDLPEPTPETLRWLLDVSHWGASGRILAKGKYFAMRYGLKLNKKNPSGEVVARFYTNQNLADDTYIFKFERGKILNQDSKAICYRRSIVKPYVPDSFGLCGSFHCEEKKEKVAVQPLKELKRRLLKNDKSYDICEYDPEGLTEFSDQKEKLFILYRYKKITDKYVEVPTSNGKSYFLSLANCKGQESLCGAIDITYSAYEDMWVKLKKIQEKKNNKILNKLFKELGACVEAKDIPCIKKYMANKEATYCASSHFSDLCQKFRNTEDKSFPVTEDTIKELKACLNYQSLLPHFMGSRGINKVCAFETSIFKTDDITSLRLAYPEAMFNSYYSSENMDLNYKEGQ